MTLKAREQYEWAIPHIEAALGAIRLDRLDREEQVARFLSVSADHRWAVACRLGVLYGLRRSEALALKWDDLDAKKSTLRIDERSTSPGCEPVSSRTV